MRIGAWISETAVFSVPCAGRSVNEVFEKESLWLI